MYKIAVYTVNLPGEQHMRLLLCGGCRGLQYMGMYAPGGEKGT